MSLFRTKETKVMIIIFGLFIQQLTNPELDAFLLGHIVYPGMVRNLQHQRNPRYFSAYFQRPLRATAVEKLGL